jgi:hypothetical protein
MLRRSPCSILERLRAAGLAIATPALTGLAAIGAVLTVSLRRGGIDHDDFASNRPRIVHVIEPSDVD